MKQQRLITILKRNVKISMKFMTLLEFEINLSLADCSTATSYCLLFLLFIVMIALIVANANYSLHLYSTVEILNIDVIRMFNIHFRINYDTLTI